MSIVILLKIQFNQKQNLIDLYHKNTLQSFIKLLQSFTNITLIIMTPEAERFNGWAAMLGFVAAVGAYVTTGQIIPGWF